MDLQGIDALWVLISALLVMLMQAGFACLEAGMVRAKNSVNVVVKNMADLAVTFLVYWAVGFAFMFGASQLGWIGLSEFVPGSRPEHTHQVFFLFEVVFCGTAVTIISGAIAERTRFFGYLFSAAVVAASVYPIYGHWAWAFSDEGSVGWLGQLGFVDFAGSTVVHSIGGWVALAALIVVGPRLGRFDPATPHAHASDLPLAMLGVLLMWVGWFGFNGGSALAWNEDVPRILLNTGLAAPAGSIAAVLIGLHRRPKYDVVLGMSGLLGGLVAITAPCHAVYAIDAVIIGAVGGVLTTLGIWQLERMEIDDVVGAVPVHLVCGIWGTLAVALFGDPELLGTGLSFSEQMRAQIIGIGAAFLIAFLPSYVMFRLMDRFIGLRVSPRAETIGLNAAEHGTGSPLVTMIEEMERQRRTGDFSDPLTVEIGTELGVVAEQYNQVLGKVRSETSRREKAAEGLRLALAKAEQANAAKTRFLAHMSHELRTPLNAIIGFAELIQNERVTSQNRAEHEEYAQIIERSGRHLLRLINDLLDLARISNEQLELRETQFELSHLCQDTADMFRSIVRNKNITLAIEVPAGSVEIKADERLLRQVLINLVGNATKFVNEEARIIIRGEVEADGRLAISVVDDGPGIGPNTLRTIWEPFAAGYDGTTRPSEQGAGLGLPLSRSIADLHGGTLTLTSKIGQGTVVTLRLPASRVSADWHEPAIGT